LINKGQYCVHNFFLSSELHDALIIHVFRLRCNIPIDGKTHSGYNEIRITQEDMMTFTLTHGDLCITLSPNLIIEDIASPLNTTLNITVARGDVKMSADMQIDIYEFCDFARDMQNLYDMLDGYAAIGEPYGHGMSLSFRGVTGGKIEVGGSLTRDFGGEQVCFYDLQFSEVIDQTSIKELVRDLMAYTQSLPV